jgi:hypothetical protein
VLGKKIVKKRLDPVGSSEKRPEDVIYAELSDETCAIEKWIIL